MKELPHSIINYIFTFIFKPYEMRLFSDINLELKDVNLLEKKCKHQINILKEYMAKTKFWRIKWLNKDFDIGTSDDEYDTDIDFTVQSCCKPINYGIALETNSKEYVHKYVGKEPSGQSFNELLLNFYRK